MMNRLFLLCVMVGLAIADSTEEKRTHAGYLHNERLRLTGSSVPTMGRVEVFIDGRWGTVCGHDWDDIDATVVCRQLGLPFSSGEAMHNSFQHLLQAPFDGPVVMSGVHCIGTETMLDQCYRTNAELGSPSCTHEHDVAVNCGAPYTDPSEPYLPGHPQMPPSLSLPVRLNGGSDGSEGRVEVYENNEWKSVCDATWNDYNANVVCRQLQFSSGRPILRAQERYPSSNRGILQERIECVGHESTLDQCRRYPDYSYCYTEQTVAGVICSYDYTPQVPLPPGPPTPSRTSLPVRLVQPYNPSARPSEGLVELNVNGHWLGICADDWGHEDALVLCRQLGYVDGDAVHAGNYEPIPPMSFWMNDVRCTGYESSLDSCPSTTHAQSYCISSTPAAARCFTPAVRPGYIPDYIPQTGYPDQEIQIVGPAVNEGYLFIKPEAGVEWGTLCNDLFTDIDATVACRSLHYSSGVRVYDAIARYGEMTGQIWMMGTHCTGSETSIFDCPHVAMVSFGECSMHDRDVAVRCNY